MLVGATVFPLSELPIGGSARVFSLLSSGNERRRMLDLGMVKGTAVEAVQKSPSGDPVAYFIRGTLLAIRAEDAEKCLVQIL